MIFSVLILFSLILVFQNENVQLRYLRAVAIGVIGTIQNTFSFIPNIFELENENRTLREININLSMEVSQLKESKLENLRLNRMLEFKLEKKLGMISGKVIGKSLIQTRNTITLNIGSSDSVREGMTVITDRGLVGKIIGTSSRYSVAQILLNKELKVSAKDQRSRVDGIISWEGEFKVMMKNVSKSADVMEGDVLITSEYSNTFPPGIPIGYVTSVGMVDNLFKKIQVQPFVNFETLEEVFVLKHLQDQERTELEKKFIERKGK